MILKWMQLWKTRWAVDWICLTSECHCWEHLCSSCVLDMSTPSLPPRQLLNSLFFNVTSMHSWWLWVITTMDDAHTSRRPFSLCTGLLLEAKVVVYIFNLYWLKQYILGKRKKWRRINENWNLKMLLRMLCLCWALKSLYCKQPIIFYKPYFVTKLNWELKNLSLRHLVYTEQNEPLNPIRTTLILIILLH